MTGKSPGRAPEPARQSPQTSRAILLGDSRPIQARRDDYLFRLRMAAKPAKARSRASTTIDHSESVGTGAAPPVGSAVANVLVKVHAMAPVAVAAASSVTVRVAMFGVAVPPDPNPLQTIEASVKPTGGADSVMVVTAPCTASPCVAPETPVPDATVVMVCGAKPLLPVKLNAPTPPFDTLVTVAVGLLQAANPTVPPTLFTVTSVVAKARPVNVPPVKVTLLPERIVPRKFEVVSVAACADSQYTLHAWAPPANATWKLVAAREPTPPVPTLKTKIPFGGPLSVSRPVSAAPAVKQWTPGARVMPARVPDWIVSQVEFWELMALYAVSKAFVTEAGTGATIDAIVQPVLVIELAVEPTSPVIVEVVQVTVPTVGMEFLPSAL